MRVYIEFCYIIFVRLVEQMRAVLVVPAVLATTMLVLLKKFRFSEYSLFYPNLGGQNLIRSIERDYVLLILLR